MGATQTQDNNANTRTPHTNDKSTKHEWTQRTHNINNTNTTTMHQNDNNGTTRGTHKDTTEYGQTNATNDIAKQTNNGRTTLTHNACDKQNSQH